MAGNVAGLFSVPPRGVILHGTRSGQAGWTTDQEYEATVNYVRNGAAGLGWNVTCGPNRLAIHMSPRSWGWSARAASQVYLAVEFAQPTVNHAITDGQVFAFCWWWLEARAVWPALPLKFPTHAEVERWGETGANDGKSDVFPWMDPRASELRERIVARLASLGVKVP